MPDTLQQLSAQHNDEITPEEAGAREKADRYLHDLLDRLFTQEVHRFHKDLTKHVTASSDELRERIEKLKRDLGELPFELKKGFQEAEEATREIRTTAEDRHNDVERALNAIYGVQMDLADKRVPEVLERLKELQELGKELAHRLDVVRGELREVHGQLGSDVHDVRRATEDVRGAVGDVRQAVGDVQRDVQEGHRANHQAVAELGALLDQRASSIDEALRTLAQEGAKQAEAAAEERALLRRWAIAATVTAAFALVAAVLAVIL